MRVYDKPIIVQRRSDSGNWEPWKKLYAFVNKKKDSVDSLTFEVRYTQSLTEIFSYLEDFLILYRGDVFLIDDYDDYMEQHLTVRFKASVLRIGRLTAMLTILRKTRDTDDEGFSDQTLTAVATVPCYRERRSASLSRTNDATFSEATDLFQFRVVSGVTFSTDYVIECGGERFTPLSVEDIKGRGVYIEAFARKVVSTSG